MTTNRAGGVGPEVDVRALISAAARRAMYRHRGVLPDGFGLRQRRYGAWRASDPHGCWAEGEWKWARREVWWMVAAYENDREMADARS